VSLRRRETELSVERALDPASPSAGTVRLTARFDADPAGSDPAPRELGEALDALRADLDAIVGPPLAALPVPRPDRPRLELVETYRPRQRELVDALLDDGEITPSEHAELVTYVAGIAASAVAPAAPPAAEPTFDRPISAVPISADRRGPSPRAVPELLREYRIESLRQAGAVRARRQISFEEYMALKRHFQAAESAGSPGAGGSDASSPR
jgi:hypothetical protein